MQIRLPQPTRRQTTARQHGTSLIEILVVLVVLVIGILSIVRLFPAGFIALRNAENSTFADRLGQAALESLKKNNAALPDGIYMVTSAGFVPNFSPEDPSYLSQYTDSDGLPANDLNKARYISNETITIPSSRILAGMNPLPPLYVVNYGPIILPSQAPFGNSLVVNGVPWAARTGDSRTDENGYDPNGVRTVDNPADILQPGQQTFLVDYAAGQIAVPTAAYKQTFTLTIVPSNGLSSTQTVTVPTTYAGGWFSTIDTTGNGMGLPAGPWASVTLSRPFTYLGTIGSSTVQDFDTDPYEFKVFSANIGTNTNMGVLAFNPIAAGRNGAQALKARISYEALDWHILHEDQDVPDGTPTIRLTLNHLKKIGDVQFDQTTFNGLIPNATTPADIVLLDLDTGTTTLLNSTSTGNVQDIDDNSGATGPYQVSYQNGRITLPNGTAQHLRIFYAGDADWAVAVQKAASMYSPANAPSQLLTTGASPVNDYLLDANDTTVYFPPCDAGKTVEFDGIAYTAGGVQKTVAVGTAAISSDKAANGLPYVNLLGSGLNSSGIITDTGPITALSFTAVRGVSARAVVIWHERNNWRVRTTDTLLTQTQ